MSELAAFLNSAWQHLQRGAADAKSPARYPVLATVSPDGLPEARTVALRKARQSAALLEVHTDTRTPKIASLRACPEAALHVWLPRAQLQIRASTRVEICTGSDVQADWERVPPASRVSYGTTPLPGTPIAAPYDYEKPPLAERFAVLRCHVYSIDLVHLDTPHRRAEFKSEDGWTGTWLAP